MAQRGLGVSAEAAGPRAEATRHTAPQRAAEASAPPRLPVQAQRVETPEAATAALDTLARTGPSPFLG